MKSLPDATISIKEIKSSTYLRPATNDADASLVEVTFDLGTTVSVFNESGHPSGLVVRHFYVYMDASGKPIKALDWLEVMNMNDQSFVLTINGAGYPVRLMEIQRVHRSCVCIHLTTTSHLDPSRLPWYLRWLGGCVPRHMIPAPHQFLAL